MLLMNNSCGSRLDNINNSVLIQFGKRPGLTNDQWYTVTLPIAYSNNTYNIFDCAGRMGTDMDVRCCCSYKSNSITNTTFVLMQDTYADNIGNWLTLGF